MAKKKTTEETTSANACTDFLSAFADEYQKKSGTEFSEWDHKEIVKSTGIDAIDAILASNKVDRGFQLRTFNCIYGKSGSGKSALLVQMAANFIKGTEGHLIYFDGEHAMRKDRVENLGVPANRFILINKETSIENYHKLMLTIKSQREKQMDELGEEYIMNNPVILIVDSFDCIYSSVDENAGTEVASATGNRAKIFTNILRIHLNICRVFNVTVLGVIQHKDNITMGPTPAAKTLIYAKSTVKFSGGNALQFNSFYFMGMEARKNLDETFGSMALEVEFKMLKSKSSVANKPINLVFLPLTGISNFLTNYKFLVDNNIITAHGSRKLLPGYEKSFFASEVENLYNTNEEFRIAFDKAVKDAYSTFIDEVERGHGCETDDEFLKDLNENLGE